MTDEAKEDWAVKAALILMTVIITSLAQTFLASFQANALETMNNRIYRIEVAVERIADDVSDLKEFHGVRTRE